MTGSKHSPAVHPTFCICAMKARSSEGDSSMTSTRQAWAAEVDGIVAITEAAMNSQ